MATNQEIIEQQRRDIQRAQQQAQQMAVREQFTKAQLLQKQAGLAGRTKRQAEARLKRRVSQRQLAQVAEAKKKFEADVAKYEAQQKRLKAQQPGQARFQDILSRIARGRPIPPGTTPFEVARAEEMLKPYISRSVGEVDIAKLQAQGLDVRTQPPISEKVYLTVGGPRTTPTPTPGPRIDPRTGIPYGTVTDPYEGKTKVGRFLAGAEQRISDVIFPGRYGVSPIGDIGQAVQRGGGKIGAAATGAAGAFVSAATPTEAFSPPQDIPTQWLEAPPQIYDVTQASYVPRDISIVTPQEIYSPYIGAYAREAPTGPQATAIYRPPTSQEQRRIDIAQEKGTAPSFMGAVADVPFYETTLGGFVGDTWEDVKDVGKAVGEAPLYGIGPKVKDIPMTIPTKEGVARVGLATFPWMGRIVDGKYVQYTIEELEAATKGKPSMELTTLSGGLKRTEEALGYVGEISAAGWEDLPGGKYVAPVVKIAPELAVWGVAPGVGAAITFGAGTEELRPENIDAIVLAQKIKAEEQYQKDIASGDITFEEDKRGLTTEEFMIDLDIDKEIRAAVIKRAETKIGIGTLVGGAAAFGAGVRAITKPIPGVSGGRIKTFRIEEPMIGGKSGFQRITQIEPTTATVTSPVKQLFKIQPKVVKEITRGHIWVGETIKATKPGKPYDMWVRQISKPPKKILLPQEMRELLKKPRWTATTKVVEVFPKGVPKRYIPKDVKLGVLKSLAKTPLKEKVYEHLIISREVGRLYKVGKGKIKGVISIKQPKLSYVQSVEKKLIKISPKKQVYLYETAGREIKIPKTAEFKFTEYFKGAKREMYKKGTSTYYLREPIKYKKGAKIIKGEGVVEEFLATPKLKGPLGIKIIKDISRTKFVVRGKKKSSQEYLQKMWEPKPTPKPVLKKAPKQVLEPLSYVPKQVKPSATKIVEVVVVDAKPFMVGGVGLVSVPYAATGKYERTIGEVWSVDLPAQQLTIPPQGVLQAEGIKVIQRPGILIRTTTAPMLREVQVPSLALLQAQEPIQVLKPVLLSKTLVKQIPSVIQKPIQVQKSILLPKTIFQQKTIQRAATKPRGIQRPKYGPPRTVPRPRIKFPLIIPSGPRPRRPIPIFDKTTTPPGYNFEIRRRGKWQRAKNPFAFATKAGAEAHAQEQVLKTAAASYRVVKAKPGRRVKKTGKKLRPKDQFLFREGKEGIMIQKKRLRILSPGEKREISYLGAEVKRRAPRKKTKKKGKKK